GSVGKHAEHGEAAYQQYHENNRENVEVPVDERLYRWPEHADETGDQEEPRSPAYRGQQDEWDERDVERAGRDSKHLVRDRRETGRQDSNHQIVPVQIPDLVELL